MTETTNKNDNTLVAATVAVSVLLAAALVAAGWFGYGWAHAALVEKPAADTREAALADARQAAINLNSFDAGNLDESFADIESSVTGSLVDDLNATRAQLAQQTKDTGAVSRAEVLGATLTSLNIDDGAADALVVLATTTTWPNQSSSKVRVTMRMTMEEGENGVWRAATATNLGSPSVLAETPAAAPVAPGDAPAPVPPSGSGGP
ncbi:mammalian cell entry protein [Rhodococcus sp. ABRD24]|uniref:mammalian cell entry protein n=1 Tax=Rhodococcus sp. ABRD24 TaxID=2507582 RepID=UPI001040C332|nr:mammalian cell entry protein [Rhodococcus sp. ABRD24]QBJ95653.1 mammalian cell entry protein [Rhodococcus sp. ABRD24]